MKKLPESKKAFMSTTSRNVDGYWSSGDEDEINLGRNLCLVASSEDDDEDDKPHYFYMASNNPLGRSIIQQVKSMITDSNFKLSVCKCYYFDPKLTKWILTKLNER